MKVVFLERKYIGCFFSEIDSWATNRPKNEPSGAKWAVEIFLGIAKGPIKRFQSSKCTLLKTEMKLIFRGILKFGPSPIS